MAKVIKPKIKNKSIGPHTIWHTTAMHPLQSGVDLNKVQPKNISNIDNFLAKNKDVISWLENYNFCIPSQKIFFTGDIAQ